MARHGTQVRKSSGWKRKLSSNEHFLYSVEATTLMKIYCRTSVRVYVGRQIFLIRNPALRNVLFLTAR